MFGIVRPSPSPSPSSSPLEWFEQEEIQQPSNKLPKHDSLSIYESTLKKLKEGGRRSLISQDSMEIESSKNAGGDLSVISEEYSEPKMSGFYCSKLDKGKGVSIQYLFSRYTSLQQKQGLNLSNTGSSTDVSSSCVTGPPASVSGFSSDYDSTGCSNVLM